MPASQSKPKNSKRELKRQDIIVSASRQMNERGATSIKLSAVAKQVGLTRNSLYYYFKDRMDLVYACYLHACQATADDLATARASHSNSIECLGAYIDQSLLGPNAERVALSDIDILPADNRTEIAAVMAANTLQLESIIQDGISRDELRPVNPTVCAQVIQGMLNWAQLWYRWADLNEETLPNHFRIAARAIKQVVFTGISADPDLRFNCELQWSQLMPRQVDTFNTESLQQEKRYQLIGAASLLFNRKGIDATSFEDIADYLGATKGAVYHYFSDKPALTKACFLQAFEQYEQIADIAISSSSNPLTQLLVVLHLNCQAQMTRTPPLTLQGSTSSLAQEHANRATAIASKMHEVRAIAVSKGLHANVEKNIVSLSSGAFFWIPQWYAKHSGIDEQELADQICTILCTGISSRTSRSNSQ